MAVITTKAQARNAAHAVADLLWAAHKSGAITFEQSDALTGRCIDLVFDDGCTPAEAVEWVLAHHTR